MKSANWYGMRNHAEQHKCPYCRAEPQETCRDPRNGQILEYQPAHMTRLRLAGVDPAPNHPAGRKMTSA